MSDYTQKFVKPENFVTKSFLGTSGGGLLRSNRFVVGVKCGKKLFSLSKSGEETLLWNATNVSCPGIDVEFGDGELNGVRRHYMKTRSDSDLSITFLETPDLEIRRLFNQWIDAGVRIGDDGNSVRRNYISDIYGQVTVAPLTVMGNTYYHDVFTNCFPYSVNNLEYDIAAENGILKTEVKFKFGVHRCEKTPTSKSGKARGGDYTIKEEN